MTSFRELLDRTRSEIIEIEPDDAAVRHADGTAVLLDVRESEERDQGAIPGSIHVSRGHLESQIEARVPDRSQPIVVLCAGGTRSVFAARTLAELGYADVSSMAGGFNRWKDDGLEWEVPAALSPAQRARYQRHLTLPEVDEAGQLRLLNAKVLLLGAGGLGSPAALYLAAAGVGTIGLVDMDAVDASNLQRQVIHDTDGLGERKVDSAARRIRALNPDVEVHTYDVRLAADNVMEILAGYDLIVDGVDNFPARYLVNDASVKLGLPVVHGSIFRFEGQVSVFDPRNGPTYRDLVREPPPPELAPSCAEAGVIGVLPGIIGTLQALEAIKMLLGIGDPLVGRLVAFDALELRFSEFTLRPDPANDITHANRDRIVITDLVDSCRASLA